MNRQIRTAWRAGLEILQPSKKDLEHGLELHRNSLVIESYGFSPNTYMDSRPIVQAILAGATAREVEALRECAMMTGKAVDPAARKEFKAVWRAAGVTCILQNAGQESNEVPTLLRRLAHYTYLSDLLRDFCPKAVSPEDIVAAWKRKGRCLYLAGNGVPLPQRWDNARDELSYIRVFFHLGIRMMHLTYNRGNMIGQGCGEAGDGGLTEFGRQVVAEMNRVGVIVDVAHSGHRTSMDAARVSEKPMVASHTVAHALNPHYRGKPDNVIRAIADTGGYVGICCVPAFLGRSGDLAAFLDHIDYVAGKYGAAHVAIGTDVSYSPTRRRGPRKLPPLKSCEPWRSLWPPPALSVPEGLAPRARLSLAWTNWPLFTVGLVQRGHKDEDIRKILGGNVLRVARALWKSREA